MIRDPAAPGNSVSDLDHKRDGERLQILGELHGEVMLFEPMAIKEISRGGAQVETAFRLQLDSLHELRLTLGQELVTYRSGLEFVELSDRVHSVISDFIEAIKDGRRAV